MNFIIRQEGEMDYESTEKIVKRAFASAVQSDQEKHYLVSQIRQSDIFIAELSLVAIDDKDKREIIGHIPLVG